MPGNFWCHADVQGQHRLQFMEHNDTERQCGVNTSTVHGIVSVNSPQQTVREARVTAGYTIVPCLSVCPTMCLSPFTKMVYYWPAYT